MNTVDQFKIVGHFGGVITSVRVRGTQLFCGFGAELAILDISTPEQPRRLGGVILGEKNIIGDICIAENRAYVTASSSDTMSSEGGLFVVDITDVQNPRPVGYLSPHLTPSAVAHDGTHAYLALFDEGLLVADTATLTFSSIVSRYWPTPTGENPFPRVRDVIVANGHAYLDVGGVDVVDMSDPGTPRRVGFIDLPVAAFAIANDLLVTVGDGTLTVFDITIPEEPVAVGNCQTPDWWSVRAMAIRETVIAIAGKEADGAGSLRLFDVASASKPRHLATLPLDADSIALTDHYLYAGGLNREDIAIVDISNRRQPALADSYPVTPVVDRVQVKEAVGYLSGSDNFYTLDLNDPLYPIILGTFSNGRTVYDIDIVATTAYLAEGPRRAEDVAGDGLGGGLQLLDVSNPRQPRMLDFGKLPDTCIPYDVVVHGNRAYLQCERYDYETETRSRELLLFDISDPTSIRQVGRQIIASEPLFNPARAGIIWETGPEEPMIIELEGAHLLVSMRGMAVVDEVIPESNRVYRFIGSIAVLPGSQQEGNLILEAAGSRGLFIRQQPPLAQLPHQLYLPLG